MKNVLIVLTLGYFSCLICAGVVTAEESPSPSTVASPTATSEATPTPSPTATAEATTAPTATPAATSSATAVPTNSPTPTATATPTATGTPRPTAISTPTQKPAASPRVVVQSSEGVEKEVGADTTKAEQPEEEQNELALMSTDTISADKSNLTEGSDETNVAVLGSQDNNQSGPGAGSLALAVTLSVVLGLGGMWVLGKSPKQLWLQVRSQIQTMNSSQSIGKRRHKRRTGF
jgi:uncharacterized membrane protein